MDIFIAMLGLVLTVITTIIAIMDIKSVQMQKREHDFLLAYKLLANNSFTVCNNVLKFYNQSNVYKMIYKENWIHQKGDKLKKISRVSMKMDINDDTEFSVRQKKLYRSIQKKLPYPNKTLEENLSLICNSSMYDGPIYALREIVFEDDGKIVLKVKMDSYFSFVNTCMLIGYESAFASLNNKKTHEMKVRRKTFPYDFKNRVSTIGFITLVILQNYEVDGVRKNVFLLHKRSSDVAECKNLVSAIPGGTVQPPNYVNNIDDETLGQTFLREFGEELLGNEEYAELTSIDRLKDYFTNTKEIDDDIFLLGMAINPINLYLEIMGVVSINMEKEKFSKSILDNLGKKKNNETDGDIIEKEFTKENLLYYANSHFSTPALKQMMKILYDDFENFESGLLHD